MNGKAEDQRNFSPRYSSGGSQGDISGEYEGLSQSKTNPAVSDQIISPKGISQLSNATPASVSKLPHVKPTVLSTDSTISQKTAAESFRIQQTRINEEYLIIINELKERNRVFYDQLSLAEQFIEAASDHITNNSNEDPGLLVEKLN